MLETPWYIDEIQNSLLSSDTADPDFLSDAAAEYAEACAATNERLRKIAPFLRKDLRADVIQLTEEEPNLLELVSILDFPERADWCALLRLWNREPPPQLLLDVATQINESYAKDAPLEQLLKRHRLLPLAGAPLSARIDTLRQLVQKDPETLVWQEDVELLEEERSKEIRHDLEEAFKTENLQALIELVDELLSPDWSKPPNNKVVNMAQELKQRLLDSKTVEELQTIAGQLIQAHGEFDAQTGRQLRDRYKALLSRLRISPPEQLTSRAQEPLDWLFRQDANEEEAHIEASVTSASDLLATDPAQAIQVCQTASMLTGSSTSISPEVRQAFDQRINAIHTEAHNLIESQKQFEAACRELDQAISQSSTVATLDRHYQTIVAFEHFAIPAILKTNYEGTVAKIKNKLRAEKRYRQTIVFSIVGVIVLALSFIIYQVISRQQDAGRADQLKNHLASNDLEVARKYVDTFKTSVRSRKKFRVQITQLEKAEEKDKQRASEFNQALVDIRDGDLASPEPDTLSQAEKLATTSKEKSRLKKVKGEIAAALQQQLEQRRENLTQELDDHREKLDTLKRRSKTLADAQTSTESAYNTFNRELNTMLTRLRKVVRDDEKDLPDLADRAQVIVGEGVVLAQSVQTQREASESRHKNAALRQAITDAIGEPASYQRALRRFAEEFPVSTLQRDYTSTAENEALWNSVEGVDQWKTFHKDDDFPVSADGSSVDTEEIVFAYQDVAEQYGETPFDSLRKERVEYWQALDARSGGDLLVRLDDLLNDREVTNLWMVQLTDGTCYYYHHKLAKETLESIGDQLIIPHLSGKEHNRDLNPSLAPQLKTLVRDTVGPAPQFKWSMNNLKYLDEIDDDNWNPSFLQIIASLRTQKDLDPIFKSILLSHVISIGGRGSYPLRAACEPLSEELKKTSEQMSKADWMAPKNAEAIKARLEAKRQFASKAFISDAELQSKVVQVRKEITAPIETDYEWLARLEQDADRSWLCLLGEANQQRLSSGTVGLYRLQTSEATNTIRFQKIGSRTGKQVTWNAGMTDSFVAGSPIYVHKTKLPDKTE